MMPPTSRKSGSAMSANSTIAVPRSSDLSRPRKRRFRVEGREGSTAGSDAASVISVRALSSMFSLSISSLQRVADPAEDVRDLGSQHRQDCDRDDGDEGEQQCVLHECLPLFAIPQLVERCPEPNDREKAPHWKRTNNTHSLSPFRARARRPWPVLQGGMRPAVDVIWPH